MRLRVWMTAALCVFVLSACGGGKEGDTSADASTDAASPAAPVAGGATQNTVDQPADAVAVTAGEGDAADSAAATTAIQPVASTPTEVTQNVAVTDTNSDVSYSFDAAFTKLAPGWWINWWGSGTLNWTAGRETRAGYVHGGTASQRLSLVSLPVGGGAHLVYSHAFANGSAYTAGVYLRADAPTEVEVLVRRDVYPWNAMARKRVTVGTTWQLVEVSGTYTWTEPGSLRVVPITLGSTIYIDDMSITKTSAPAPVAGGIDLPAAGGANVQLVPFSASTMDEVFTLFAPGWYFNAMNGTSQGTFAASRETRAGYVNTGAASQRFQVIDKKGGDIHLIAPRAFIKGKTYRATLYLRADTATPVKVFMRRDEHPWDAFASKSLTLGTTWQKVEIEGSYISSAMGSLRVSLVNPTGTVWVDDMKIEEVSKNDMAPYSTATIADTLFGMHVNKLGSHANWPGLSTQILRLHNTATTWRDLEPTNGGWDWVGGGGKRLDMYVDYVASKAPGAQILYTLGMTPQWASSTPTVAGMYGLGASGAPRDMADWRDYVRTLAQRYKGRIRHWELWNEPDFAPHWIGTPEQMVEMARIAQEELKAADPANQLVGPGFSAGQGMAALDRLLGLGLGAYIDAVGYHFYYSTNPESLGSLLDNVRAVMKTYGVENKPLWITEGAFICNPAVTDCATAVPTAAQSRSVNARAMFMMASRGVANFNFHVWEATDSFRKLVEADFATQTSAGQAYAEARQWAKGSRIVDAYRIDEKVYVVRLNRGTENFVVVWATQAGTVVNIPTAWTVSKVRALAGSETALPSTRQITVGLEPVMLKP